MKKKQELAKRDSSQIAMYIVLTLLAIFSIGPLLLMIINSFKSRIEINMNPLALPTVLKWQNFRDAFVESELGSAVVNSAFISITTVILTSIVASMAAYVLARKLIKRWPAVSLYFLICTTLPVQLFLIPLFFIYQNLGLVNSRLALAWIYTAIYTPFSIFLLRSYFLEIPEEMVEAARIDGANDWQIFKDIFVPIILPGFLTIALVVGLWSWNEFLLAMTFLQEDSLYTVAVKFYSFTGRYISDRGKMMAYATAVTVPIIVTFIAFQRQFIEGMASGGMKG